VSCDHCHNEDGGCGESVVLPGEDLRSCPYYVAGDYELQHLLESRTVHTYGFRNAPQFTVEAMGPLTVDNAASIADWCGGGVNRARTCVFVPHGIGGHEAHVGDFVIKTPARFRVYKQDEFFNDFKLGVS
jgi:hypothetical protein